MAGPSSVELEMEVTIFLTKNENFVQLKGSFAPLITEIPKNDYTDSSSFSLYF
jgi:hypothetical protein